MATHSPEPSESSREISQPPSPPVARAIPQESLDDFVKDKGYDPRSVKWDARYESAEERNARLEKEKLDDSHKHEQEKLDNSYKRKKEAGIYVFAGLVVATVITLCIIGLTNPSSSEKDKAWSQSTLTIIVGGVVGYLFGKTSSSESKK